MEQLWPKEAKRTNSEEGNGRAREGNKESKREESTSKCERERETDGWIEVKGRNLWAGGGGEESLAAMGYEYEANKERNGQPSAGKKTDRVEGARERGGGLRGKGR